MTFGAGGVLAPRPEPRAALPCPSFLAAHPDVPVVYAVAEEEAGRLVTLGRDDGGGLVVLDDRSTGGATPCHVAVSPDRRWVAAANYADGTLGVVPIDADGIPSADALVLRHAGAGPHADRQDGPHCHQVTFDSDLLTVTDLGTDRVHRYVHDGNQWVQAQGGEAVLHPGSGPRHQVVDGEFRHVAGELDGTVRSYRVDAATGTWEEIGSAATTTSTEAAYPSHLELYNGHLYVANRGPDTIGVLELDAGVPTLLGEVATGGSWPRHFAIVDNSLVVANERSHEITVLRFAGASPLPGGVRARLATGSPTCIVAAGPA